ncbi:hypothetical protein M3765_24050, partial [Streptomyces thermoviolaceus]|uniref:hypothetical protein n=1 Tax=Streptomyces thermoviolaceus TaxID=1952 RepID=UPI00203CBDAC
MAELLSLAEHHGSARWLWQSIPPISARRRLAGWAALMERAAVLAERLGNPDRVRRQNRPAAFVRKDRTGLPSAPARLGQDADGSGHDSVEREQQE